VGMPFPVLLPVALLIRARFRSKGCPKRNLDKLPTVVTRARGLKNLESRMRVQGGDLEGLIPLFSIPDSSRLCKNGQQRPETAVGRAK
jgi:hypothetical protein